MNRQESSLAHPVNSMPRLRGVLLDIDGTLVASNDAHARAWTRALKECNHNVSYEDVRPLIGMGGDKLLPRLCGIEADSPDGKKITALRSMIFQRDGLPGLHPTAGAERLLMRIQEAGLKMVAASSARNDELDPLLKICNADKYIEDAASSDDAGASKPDPDILHAALACLRLRADEAVMIGDTPYDVEAARKAGMRVIGLTCGGWGGADLQADEIYRDPQDLRDHFERSLLAH